MGNSKPRILIAASTYPPDAGGPALHAQRQLEGFRERGLKVGLVALAHYRKWPKGFRHLLFFFKILSLAWRYNTIYAHDAVGTGIPAFVVAKILRKKFVVRIGGDVAWERKAERGQTALSLLEWYGAEEYHFDRLFKLSRWLMTRAHRVIVPSPLLRGVYTKHYNVDPSRISVVPNPTPDSSVSTGSRDEQTIVYASRLVKYKNLAFVLSVLSKVFPDYPALKFIIMGDGPEEENLSKISREFDIEERVLFTGRVSQEEVLDKTSRSLFVIAPALTEFNPNYVLQAISLNKPFLISKENGLPFEVPQEFKFDPRDSGELDRRVRAMLDPQKYLGAIEALKNIPRTSWQENIEANVNILTSLLNGPK